MNYALNYLIDQLEIMNAYTEDIGDQTRYDIMVALHGVNYLVQGVYKPCAEIVDDYYFDSKEGKIEFVELVCSNNYDIIEL